MNDYWLERVERDEAHAQKIASEQLKKHESLYRKSYKKITNYLNALCTEILEKDETPTRTELWRFSKYISLLNAIDSECSVIGAAQISIAEFVIDEVFKDTLGFTKEAFQDEGLNTFYSFQTKEVLNQLWSGKSYSERIWNNTNELAVRTKNKITDMVVLGKNPSNIKKEIQKEFNTSFNQANRLVRTEASYTYNQAAISQYKKEGVKRVKFKAESNCCDICAQYKNKIYNINEIPFLPVHPNCRCCYIPIVDI